MGVWDSRNSRKKRFVASTIGGIVLFAVVQLSSADVVTGLEGFLFTVFSRIACGVVVAMVVKFFSWYGMSVNRIPHP